MPKNAAWFGRLASMFEERIVLDSTCYANTLGFRTLPRELERFLYDRVKPDSDEGCVFMFQPL